jgi:hypothetical protein
MAKVFLMLLISFIAIAEDRFKPVNGGVNEANVFDSIMSNPQIKAIYDACEAKHATDAAATATCFNLNLSGNKALYESAKEQVLAAKKAKDKSEQFNVGSLQDKKTSPEIKKLEEFLSKRLEASLYEDIKGGNPNFVDAGTFFSLYDTQISKNILSATSSYCLDTNSSLNFFIYTDQLELEKVRTENISKLGKINIVTKKNEAYLEWASCLQHIEVLCVKEPKDVKSVENGVEKTDKVYYIPPKCPSPDEACAKDPKKKEENEKIISETTRRACEVNNYIKSMRQNLIATKQIQDQMKKWQGAGGVKASAENVTKNSRFQLTGNRDKEVPVFQGQKEGKSFDDLSSVTTAELEKSDYNKVSKETNDKKEKCSLSTVENDPECKDVFYNKEELKEAKKNLAEIALNLQIKEDQIRKIDEPDNIKLIEFLKQEGRSQDEIDTIMKGGESKIAEIRSRIISEATNEKQAIIDSYAKIIKDKDRSGTSNNSIASTKPSEMKQLIHYNNIVSGYLEIKSEDKDKKQSNTGNTYILYKELKGNSGRETASSDGMKANDDFNSAVTRQKIEESGLKEEKPSSGNSKLDVKTLNTQILNH